MKKLLLVIFAAIILPSMLYSQDYLKTSKYRQPFFSIDASFGYNQPLFDLSGGSVAEFYDFRNYAASWGYDASVKLKFTVANFKPSQLRVTWLLGYSRFLSDFNVAYGFKKVEPGWPTIGFQTLPQTAGTSGVSINHPYTAVGMDYVVYTDRKRSSLFSFGGDITLSVPFGKVEDHPTVKVDNDEYNNILNGTRFGFGVTAGYTVRVVEWMGLSVTSRFQLSNLIGKSSDAVSEGKDIPLNDGDATNLHPNLTSRTIGFLGINGGLTFFFGGKK